MNEKAFAGHIEHATILHVARGPQFDLSTRFKPKTRKGSINSLLEQLKSILKKITAIIIIIW